MKQGSEEWHAARRLGVTSTDIVAILGISPYKSEGDVARAKDGAIDEPEDADHARRLRLGHALESVVAAEDEVEHGFRLRRVQRFIVHPDSPLLRTSLDFERIGERTIVEVKTTAGRRFDDGLPDDVEAQVRWQMGVARYPRAHVAALAGGSRLLCYDVDHDADIFAGMVSVAEDFWRRYLAGGPFAENRDSTKRAWPSDDGTELDAASDPDLSAAVDQLLSLRAGIADAQSHEDALVAAIQTRMGPATAINGPSWRVSWKKTKDVEVTDYKLQAQSALTALGPHDPTTAEALATLYTTTRPGARRFVVRNVTLEN